MFVTRSKMNQFIIVFKNILTFNISSRSVFLNKLKVLHF